MEQEIQHQIATMLNAIDARDWKTVRAAFAPTVDVDYTSLFGGGAETLTIDTLLSAGADWYRGSTRPSI